MSFLLSFFASRLWFLLCSFTADIWSNLVIYIGLLTHFTLPAATVGLCARAHTHSGFPECGSVLLRRWRVQVLFRIWMWTKLVTWQARAFNSLPDRKFFRTHLRVKTTLLFTGSGRVLEILENAWISIGSGQGLESAWLPFKAVQSV